MSTLPLALRAVASKIDNNVREVKIIDIADEKVRKGMTLDILVGKVVSILLYDESINQLNDESFAFNKYMFMKVFDVLKDRYSIKEETVKYFNKKGELVIRTSKTIDEGSEQETFNKTWFREVNEPQTHIELKGSRKIKDNNSKDYLEMLASENFRVKVVNERFVDLYANLLYVKNKNNITESKILYRKRLMEVCEETKLYMGYEYANTRKLDASGRDYSLNRFGYANEYGDAFEKFMIEPDYEYIVNKDDIAEAKAFLLGEFKVKSWRKLFEKANKAIEKNLRILSMYENGRDVEFTIDTKTFGKYMWICDIVNNIIYAEGQPSSSVIGTDLTNSGGIMTAYQFGDEKYMRVTNLLGGEVVDNHSLVADYFGISRDEAKSKFVGPNHGSLVRGELVGARDTIFGERYSYIRKIAEYGIELAFKDVPSVTITAPDGIKAIWNPYAKAVRVNMEDDQNSTIHGITPFTKGLDADPKVSGLYARLVHSCDSYVLRMIKREMINAGVGIKTTLDCYYTRPSLRPVVIGLLWRGLSELDGYFEAQLNQIEMVTGISRGWNLPTRELDVIPSENIV